eukprot:gb/GECG01014223.1/.p1 GENE.gb/GECG01014223.1/~~gb/GECG01014223.1/.p1  ORF type:complete len:752 (+),score=80.44 gb/GECG01014223.1/:1-2256(+)
MLSFTTVPVLLSCSVPSMGLIRKISRTFQRSSNKRIAPLPPASENPSQDRRASVPVVGECREESHKRDHRGCSARRSSLPSVTLPKTEQDCPSSGSACSSQVSATSYHQGAHKPVLSTEELGTDVESFIVRNDDSHVDVEPTAIEDPETTVLIFVCRAEVASEVATATSAAVHTADKVSKFQQLMKKFQDHGHLAIVFEAWCIEEADAYLEQIMYLAPRVPRIVLADSDTEIGFISPSFTHVVTHSRKMGILDSLQRCSRIAEKVKESSSIMHSPYSRSIFNKESPSMRTNSHASFSSSRSQNSLGRPDRSNSPNDNPERWIPLYLRDCPQQVLECFGGDYYKELGLLDSGFRKLVKTFCLLPAYFGIVLFQRILEYRDIVGQLVKQNRLQADALSPNWTNESATPSSKINRKVSLRDFLRVWTPDLRNASRADKFIKLAQPPNKSYVLSLEASRELPNNCSKGIRQRVLMRDMQPLVEALVERHPDLHFLKRRPVLRSRYITAVLSTIGASLYGTCTGMVSIKELRQSNVADMFYACASVGLEEVTPFSVARFQQLHGIFSQAAKLCGFESLDSPDEQDLGSVKVIAPNGSTMDKTMADNTKVSPKSLRRVMRFRYPPSVENRLFSSHVRKITSGEEGKLNFEDFMWFYLAREDRSSDSSMEYWFRALDFDDDGYLSEHDICQCLKEKKEIRPDDREVDELCKTSDLLGTNLLGNTGVSLVHFRRYCSGSVLYEAVLNVKNSKNNGNPRG